jgi:LysM repeat protein
MIMIKRRWQTAVGILLILFLATACFQSVGDQGGSPLISQEITSTPTEEPSLTPTDEPTEEPKPTEEPEETADAQAADDEEAVDVPIAENPTETPTETATEAPEVAQLGESSGLGQLVATDTPAVDDFSLTATHIIETATANALVPTWTADALTQQALQLFTPTPTIDPLFGGGVASATPGVILSGADCVHEVRAGDTLFRMSMNYGIPVMDIANRNGITNPDLISVGQMLVINGCGTTGFFPPATSTPTQEAFGSGGSDLSGSGSGGGGGGCQAQYTVNQYDTLFQISQRYGVPVQSIANANGISNINVIDMGAVLCIPAS